MWRSAIAGARVLFRRDVVDRELDDEVAHYLDLSAREKVAAGMSATAARRAARLEFGGVAVARERVQSFGWETTVQNIFRDIRYALRRLQHAPGFTLVAMLSLALGIGANTAIFSFVNAALLRPLPVESPSQLLSIQGATSSGTFSYPDFAELRDGLRTVKATAAWGGISASMGESGNAELVGGLIVTGDFFPILGLNPERGRLLGRGDDVTPGNHPVTVLGYELWQRRFGGAADAVGRTILLNGHPFTVVGVAPRGFEGLQPGVVRDFYVPMMMQAVMRPPRSGYSGEMNPDLLHKRTNRWLYGIARMQRGTPVSAVNADLARVEQQLALSAPDPQRNPSAKASVFSLRSDEERNQLSSIARLLLGVVGAVLLIACANVANLLLSRATARRREIAVRLALGATRARLIRQLLVESLLLALGGGVVGLAIAWGLLHVLRASPPPTGGLPVSPNVGIDPLVLLFTCTIALASGVVFGLVPALQASRPQLVPALKDEQYVAAPVGVRWSLRNVIVVAQIAMSMTLLIAAGLFIRSLDRVRRMDTGLDASHVLTVPLSINLLRYTTDRGRAFYQQVVDRVEALPGVRSASMARWVPLSGGSSTRSLNIEGRDRPVEASGSEGGGASRNELEANVNTVGLKFFETMGIALLRGRDFNTQDLPDHPGAVIVNRAFALKHFPDTEALGKRISLRGPEGPWLEIVGVVADSKSFAVDETPAAVAYVPLAQNHETGMVLQVRTAGDPNASLPAVTREIHELERSLPVSGARSLADWVALALYQTRAETALLGGFGVIALVLAAIGLYGVMSYSVSRRTRELGLRMALGAESADVIRQVLREGMVLVVTGLIVGVLLAFAATRLLAGFLYGMDPVDPPTFVIIPLLLCVVALCACAIPAWRATRASPMVALRTS